MTGGEARVSWLRYDKTRTLRNVDTFALTSSIQVEASMRIVKRLNLRIDVACYWTVFIGRLKGTSCGIRRKTLMRTAMTRMRRCVPLDECFTSESRY